MRKTDHMGWQYVVKRWHLLELDLAKSGHYLFPPIASIRHHKYCQTYIWIKKRQGKCLLPHDFLCLYKKRLWFMSCLQTSTFLFSFTRVQAGWTGGWRGFCLVCFMPVMRVTWQGTAPRFPLDVRYATLQIDACNNWSYSVHIYFNCIQLTGIFQGFCCYYSDILVNKVMIFP